MSERPEMKTVRQVIIEEAGINKDALVRDFAKREKAIQGVIAYILKYPHACTKTATKLLNDKDPELQFGGICIHSMISLAGKWTWDVAGNELAKQAR